MDEFIEMEAACSVFNFDDIPSMSDKEIRNFKDDRNFNQLMLASVAGRGEAVKNLIGRELFVVDFEVEGESAVCLAWSGGHHEVTLELLKANAKFPENIQHEATSDELKEFLDLSREMHLKVGEVKEENLEEVKNFLKQVIEANSGLKYFYDLNNCSLLKSAILSLNFELFKFLWEQGLKLSPSEEINSIVQNFSDENYQKFLKVHLAIFENFQNLSNRELIDFRDCRDFSALTLAVEYDKKDFVKFSIEKGLFIVDALDHGFTAARLAWLYERDDILLMLLKANSEFPLSFDPEQVDNEELKRFVETSLTIHESIEANDVKKVQEILLFNPDLRFFYDLNNRSAFCHAIESRKFEIYKVLIQNLITCGPYESLNSMLAGLSEDEREELSQIQLELADPLVSKTVLSLMTHSFVGVDSKNQKRTAAMEAFNFLLRIPRVELILKLVATQKNFQIVFDFTHETVQFVDPNAELYMSGAFYSQGRIYIAAAKLFDEDERERLKVIAALGHELCHFAMFITFKNFAKPYRANDLQRKEDFDRVDESCKVLKDSEELIRLVFTEYDPDWHSTELIVRPVQIDVQYHGLPELEQKQKDFKELYDFFDDHCIPEMKKILPGLEEKADKGKRINKLKKFNIGLMILVALSLLLGGLVAFLIFDPAISWSDLSSKDRIKIKDSVVNFQGVEVKFGELFANDSKVFGLLSSEQIKKALKGETEELSKALNQTLHHQVFLTWSNMTKELKQNFLTRKVDFQGQKVSIGKIVKKEETFDLLSSIQVREIFEKEVYKISVNTHEKVKTYINRFFIDETLNVASEQFYYSLLENDLQKRRYIDCYKNGKVDLDNLNVIDFNRITEDIQTTRLFLLSSAAGDGKSTAFRHFSLKLKEKFPQMWIQFVNLKSHLDAFEIGENLRNVEVLSNFLGSEVLALKGFDLEIFKELFASGNVIFLWDGVDEISPKFKEFMLDLAESIANSTQNFQFISTRPEHSEDFKRKFDISAQKLIPFSELDRFEFLVRTIADKFKDDPDKIFEELKPFYNQSFEFIDVKYSRQISKAQKIFDSAEKSLPTMIEVEAQLFQDRFVSNPLLISMISEISCDENFKVGNSTFNSYQLYDTFIDQKLEIVDEKGKIVQKDRNKALKSREINIWQVHQFFAFKLFGQISPWNGKFVRKFNYDFLKDHLEKSLEKFSFEQISRFGILQVNSQYVDDFGDVRYDFDFAHRTFAEFFVAQFFLDFVNYQRIDLNHVEDKWSVLSFLDVWIEDKTNFPVVKSFILDGSKLEDNSNFFEFWDKNVESKKSLVDPDFLKEIEIAQFSSFFNMQNFDFNISIDPNDCGDIFQNLKYRNPKGFWKKLINLTELEVNLGKDTIRAILLYRQINRFQTALFCSMDAVEGNLDFFQQLLDAAGRLLNKTEIDSLLFTQIDYKDGVNLVMKSLENDLIVAEDFWNFTQRFLKIEEQKKLLEVKDKYSWTVLQQSVRIGIDIFRYFKEVYEKLFTPAEIRKQFLECEDFVYLLMIADDKIQEELIKYLKELFGPERLGHVEFKMSDKIYTEFFPYLFDMAYVYDFKSYWSAEELLSQRQFRKLLKYRDERHWTILQKSALYDDLTVFPFMKETYEKHFSKNEIKESFLESDNFIVDLIRRGFANQTKVLLEELLEVKDLKEIELKIDAKAFANEMLTKNLTRIKIFWNITEKVLGQNQIKKLLSWTDNEHWTVLQESTFSEFPECFTFVLEIYEKYFTIDEIRDSFLASKGRTSNDFIKRFGDYEVLGYLDLIFRKKRASKKILNHLQEIFHSENLRNVGLKVKENLFMKIVSFKNLEDVKFCWEFLEKFCAENEKKNILMFKDDQSALEASFESDGSKVFEYVKEIYGKHLSKSEIKKLLLSNGKEVVEASECLRLTQNKVKNKERQEEISRFLRDLFKYQNF